MYRFLSLFLFALFAMPLSAQWQKINDVDYVWGPFKIYTLSLYSESGQYQTGQRPLMLSLTYAKPVDGRDFAISLARSWSNLGITLPDQDNVVDRLRKIMPNIRSNDVLSYIALEDKGYFILNDTIIPEEFNQDFNNAVVAVWLDPRVEIGRKLLNQESAAYQAHKSAAITHETAQAAPVVENVATQAVETAPQSANSDNMLKTEASKPTENNPVENKAAETKTTENKAAENKTSESKTENKEAEMPKTNIPADVEYPNPEREVLPPYDPLSHFPYFA